MSNTVKERITVSGLSKFGFKVGEEFINLSKKLPESDKTKVVPGAVFEAELFVADSGKRYLNKILSASPQVPSASVAPLEQIFAPAAQTPEAKPKFIPKFQKKETVADSERMSKADWSAKDRSQLIGGLSHDAAAITAAFVTVSGELQGEAILKSYKFILEGMLKVREELK